MIDTFLKETIRELGPTGLLVIGLYYILNKAADKIAQRLLIINHELGQIRDLLQTCAVEFCKKKE